MHHIMFVCRARSSGTFVLNIYMFGMCAQVPEKCISKSGRNDIAGNTGAER